MNWYSLLWMLAGIGLTVETAAASVSLSPVARLQRLESDRAGNNQLVCPTELEPLITALLRDLPSYITRSHDRALRQQVDSMSYAIVASRPEFMPLPVESSEYANPRTENLYQVFFTVLERQYAQNRVTELQQYHWLFLTQTNNGWQLAFMFSRIGSYPPTTRQVLTPPRESSNGITAQAIRTWLRDCRAGAVNR